MKALMELVLIMLPFVFRKWATAARVKKKYPSELTAKVFSSARP